ncbi:MAG: carbohydrate ABC transporter permease [Micromonosporaceae bacterium]|jgi:alpha-glucoside transport system permease protein|nr:carbohydrate ABC transporter permease [Micromonosporaceae bacterium]
MSVGAVETAKAPVKKRQEPAVKAIRRSFSSPLASFLILVLTVLWTLPTFGLLVTSFRPEQKVATTGWWTVFTDPQLTLSNYHTVLFEAAFGGGTTGLMPYVINSLAITIPGTIFPLVVASMAAYALAWVRFRGSDVIFFLIFALQVIPLQLALIPLLQLYSSGKIGGVRLFPESLHLTGTYWPVWLSHTMFAMPLAVFLLHNFISQLPREVMEAATVDGADHFKVFRTIVVPLAAPALASFAIFQFLWVWNDLLVGLTFAGGTAEVAPLTARLLQLSGSFGSRWHLLTAGAFVSIVIPLIVFFALQRYFVRGLLAGSVKG